ncbi:MAG: SEL1-like repeat protein [Patescibacteria group bacterium]|nr:SEL1-like repeat protein [Patescibacteria group bacterium]
MAKNKEHIDTLTKQAAEGSAYAQYSLGICYLYGSEGAETNAEKAKMLLELSAVQGNAFAKQKLDELQPDTQKPATP